MMSEIDKNIKMPLCVDLDGTLIKTDSILESTILAIKMDFRLIFLLPFWIGKGKNHFKNKVVAAARPDAALFPYNQDVIDIIKEAKDNGREIVLTTATKQAIADDVQLYTGLFDRIMASSDTHNNRSGNKRDSLTEQFGEKGYDYMGNSSADLKVFESCNTAYLVSDNKNLINKARALNNNLRVISNNSGSIKDFIKEIRVYQWIKNILIFLPLLLAHEFYRTDAIIYSIIAFFCFSFTASFIYVINDLLDLESDRKHQSKRNRPFAAGKLEPIPAFGISFFLMLASITVSFIFLPNNFGLILVIYFVLTTLYSFYLKKIVIADIIVLAMLYSIRIVAGGELTHIPLSKWFIAFSLFLFFSLAIIKRFTELNNLQTLNKSQISGRGYVTDDIRLLLPLGVTSGYLSVLIFLLYIFSPEVTVLYQTPILLLPVGITLLGWITRMWFIAYRGQMDEDPVVYTAKDKFSYLFFIIMVSFVIGAMF